MLSRNVRAAIVVIGVLIALSAAALVPTERVDPRVADSLRALGFILVDEPAPTFSAPSSTGGDVVLSNLRGQWVLVNFWASWCEPCREEMPSMRDMARSFNTEELQLVALSLDTDESAMSRFLIEMGVTPDDFLLARDESGAISARYGTRLLPETWLVDPEGRIVARIQGAIDWTSPDVLELFRVLLRDGWRPGRG